MIGDESTDLQPLEDIERDALHVLALSIIPFRTPTLRQARLIKNSHLESVLEVFSGKHTGSGQISISRARREFSLSSEGGESSDLSILRELSRMPSYDVYSLRILLRKHGITVDDHDALKLSEHKQQELSTYMSAFTRPLIQSIYGGQDEEIREFKDVLNLFRHPDVKKAKEKLEMMAKMLNIKIEAIPAFLEDYGDIFLSLSYYRQCLERIKPTIGEVLTAIDNILESPQFQHDRELVKTCVLMKGTITNLVHAVMKLFKQFNENSKDMWDNVSEENFRKVEKMIRDYHTAIGGALCPLTVKMSAWSVLFPNRFEGGLARRAEFIMTDMVQGLESIKKVEARLTGKSPLLRKTIYETPHVIVADDLNDPVEPTKTAEPS